MAHGPTPKQGPRHSPYKQRRREAETVTLQRDGKLRGPELPTDGGREWHPRTLEWWEVWRRSPQAQLFEPTDWHSLMRAAILVDYIWTTQDAGGKVSAAAVSEVRLIEEKFGATHTDRLRARMRIAQDESAEEATPKAAPGEALRARMRAVK